MTPSQKRVRLLIGKNPDGSYKYKNFCGKTKKEAIAKRDKYIAQRAAGIVEDEKRTLGQLMSYYISNVIETEGRARGTVELYWRQYEQKIKDAEICLRPVRELRTADLQQFFNDLSSGRRDGKPIQVAPSALVNSEKVMRAFFRWSARSGYSMDLMQGVTVRKPEAIQTDVQTFTSEEAQLIINTPNRLHFLFVLALSTGLREAELLGLRYSDFRDGSVTVSRQSRDGYGVDGKRTIEIQDVKSGSSRRTVPLTEFAQEEFQAHRERHRAEMRKNRYKTDLVFTTNSGRRLDPSNFRTAWGRHLKRAGIEHKKFHSCRATFCTELCRAGVPLEMAAKLMGHADVSVTARYYRRITDGETRSAVEKLSPFLGAKKEPTF